MQGTIQTGTIQFFQISPEEQETRIYNRLKGEFEQLKKDFEPKRPTQYLTRNELKELLSVDLSTIHNWQKKGKLRAYGIGSRVYFKRHEVEQSIKPLNF